MSGADTGGNLSCINKSVRDVGAANLMKSQLEQLLLIFQKHQIKNDKWLRGMGCLVEYLSDSIKPHNLLRFIAHIKTQKEDLHITLSHLRFAHNALCIAPAKLIPFTVTSEKLDIENMKNQLNYYINQNYLESMVMNNDLSKQVTITRAEQMQSAIEDFIQNKSDNIEVLNVCDAQAVLGMFRNVFNKYNAELIQSINDKDEELFKLRNQITPNSVPRRESKYSQSTHKDLASPKKIRPNDKRSGSFRTEQKSKKSSRVGSIENYGKSLGKTASSHFQGNVTRSKKGSQKGKSKKSSKSSEKTSGSMNSSPKVSKTTLCDQDFEKSMEINIKGCEDVWKMFTEEENYEMMYNSLKLAANEYKHTLDKYNEVLKQIQYSNQKLESRKEYRSKIDFFKQNKEFECCSDEDLKLKDTEKKVNDAVTNLLLDLTEYKENLLTLQAELKINACNYCRIKKNIGENFMKYCGDKYNMNLGTGENQLDDKLLTEDLKETKTIRSLTEEEEKRLILTFYSLRSEMMKEFKAKRKKK